MNPTSAISSRLASSPSPPKLSAKAPRSGFQARSRIVRRTVLRPFPPARGPVRLPEMRGDLRQPVAGGPAHQARRGMHPGHGAQLPHPGIGLVVHRERALAHPFEALELHPPRPGEQPAVEERLGRREHRVAVDVVLHVLERLVAGPHRTHAAKARERRHGTLGEAAFEADSIHRLEMPTLSPGVLRLRLVAAHDVVEIPQVVLHRLDFGEAVERPHHEERIPQPAVAVVPVPAGIGGLRDAGGHRRDDRPVSSNAQSFRVMAARVTASCHSKGSARRRVHRRQ